MGRLRNSQGRRQIQRAVGAVIVEAVERRMMLSSAASPVLDGLGATGSSELGNFVELDDRVIFTGQGYGADPDFAVWSTDGTPAGTYEIHDAIDFGAAPTRMGDNVYFTENGRLYRSDGTPAGTELLTPNGPFVYGGWLEASGNTLYFPADDGAHGTELWKSDGTAAGTSMVADITPGPAISAFTWLVGSNGALFFKANGKLYHTDGTAAGTQALRTIGEISGQGYNAEATADGTLYFTDFGPGEATLFKSDGTVAGTQAVKPDGSVRWPMYLTPIGNTMYFAAQNSVGERDVYKSDGTPAGTQVAVDIPRTDANIRNLTAANGRLFFTARENVSGFGYGSDLWQTDGTTSSIIAPGWFRDFSDFDPSPLKADHNALYFVSGNEIRTTDGSAPPSVVYTANLNLYPYQLTMAFAGDTMLFLADDHVHGMELWKTDGTVPGTQLAVDLSLRYFGYDDPGMFAYIGKGGIFVNENDVKGREPWFTDGTPGGTFRLKDLNTSTNNPVPDSLLTVNGVTYFSLSAYDSATDTYTAQLWRTDGTAAGTSIVKTLVNGGFYNFTDLNGTLIFTNYDDAHGEELWKSDGTDAGTVMIKDILPGSESSIPLNLSVIDGVLYFSADDGVNGRELYSSNGTAAGTVRVKDIVPGSESGNPQPLFALNNLGIFGTRNDLGGSTGLYRTTGTEVGTFLLGDVEINEGYGVSVLGGNAYFIGQSAGHGYELWKTNGTVAGTQMVIELGAGTDDSNIGWLASLNNALYFMQYDGTLWTSNGTAAGTTVVAATGLQTSAPFAFGNALYFMAAEPDHGGELWKSDGTSAGTVLVKDINPGPDWSGVNGFRSAGGTLYFVANDGVHGEELWRTDGTEAGTVMIKDTRPGGLGGVFTTLGTRNNEVIFFGTDGGSQGIFFSDGTEGGTRSIGALTETSLDSNPYGFAQVPSGQVYFFANDGSFDQLYRTDGTTAGTVQVTHFADWGQSGYGAITSYNGDVYFFDGPFMWKVDAAAPQGATLITQLVNGGSATPSALIGFDGKIFFSHYDVDHGQELWVSDGTAGGTHLFLDINTNPFQGSDPGNFIIGGADGALYFIARDADHGIEIWKSDGTVGGTVRLTDFVQDPWLGPSQLTRLGDTLYFTYFDVENGAELWRTDGSVGGTVRIADPDPGYPYNSITNLTAMGNAVYFIASDLAQGAELWTSDGTAAGTHIVRDIRPGASGADIRELRTIQNGDALAFTARDGIHGREVWISGGTAATTVLVDDIAPAAISSSPRGLVEGDGVIAFFAADDADGGRGIWSAPLPDGIFPSFGSTWSITGPAGAQTLNVTSGTVGLSNASLYRGKLNLNVSNAAEVIIDNTHYFGALSISGGAHVSIATASNATIVCDTLAIADGSSLDLGDNDMIVRNALVGTSSNGVYNGIAGFIQSGRLFSNMLAAQEGLTVPAAAKFGDIMGMGDSDTDVWNGQTINGAAVIIKYTWAGDGNLDGVIDGGDYGIIDNFIQAPGATGYFNGDFNYDGVIDGGDYGVIDNNIQAQDGPL